MKPEFVTTGASLAATARYWTVEGGRVNVRWTKINAGENCDLCGTCTRGELPGVPTALPEVLVMSRSAMDATWEATARLHYQAGCGAEPTASFVPPTSADYAVALRFPGEPIPTPSMGESGTRFVMMPRGGILLPLRRLKRESPDSPRWIWRIREVPGGIKEAFDPGLHVARVRIFQATCNAVGSEPRDDECGDDHPMDANFDLDSTRHIIAQVVAPASIRVGGETTSRECRADPQEPDGDIDFGMERADELASRCAPDEPRTFFTPASFASGAVEGLRPLQWTVELGPEVIAGLPQSVLMENESTFLWIEFTLKPRPR